MVRSLVLGSLLLAACATPTLTPERYQALSPAAKENYDKYHQFMTDSQAESFLSAPDDDARKQIIASLHVEERLERYPKFIQDAIWSRQPVVGMDKPALFLALGKPDAVDRIDVDPDTHEVPKETWRWRRGPMVNQDWVVTLTNDQVIEVQQPVVK